jgi:hypothetical protein
VLSKSQKTKGVGVFKIKKGFNDWILCSYGEYRIGEPGCSMLICALCIAPNL